MRYPRMIYQALIACLLAACTSTSAANELPAATAQLAIAVETGLEATPTVALQASATATEFPQEVSSTPTAYPSKTTEAALAGAPASPTLPPENWQDFPVIPEPNAARLAEVYARGLELGNNPNAFSKIGDCGSTPAWFLGDFDLGPRYYRLGEYDDLEPVIETFQGSFERTSLAAKSGFNASSVFSPLWANREACQPDEAPLLCEYRVHRPSFAFIMLGTNDVYHKDSFEPQMRRIIELSLEAGVIPILSTKADNLEGDGGLNATIAALAVEYELPLLNYWRAAQPLPNQGLQQDEVHITWAPNRFDDPKAMQKGWPWRNLTSLQALDAVWRAASSAR